MGPINLSRRVRQQPQGAAAALDRSNPVTRGLEFVWLGSDPNRIISTGKAKFSSNSAPRSITAAGVGIAPNGSSANLQMAANPVFMSNTWTGVAYFQNFRATGTPSALFQSAQNAGASTNDRSLGIDSNGNLTAYLFDGGGKTTTDATGALVDGQYVVAAASSPGNAVECWKNGALVASLATSNGGFTGYGASGPIYIAGYGFGSATAGAGSGAKIALLAYWSRELSAAEHAMLADNPYCLFRQNRRLWAYPAPPTPSGNRPQVFICT